MVKILNILAIVFPFLIIVFGLIRYYSDGKRSFGGLINFLALLLLLIGLFRYFFIGSGGGGGSNHSGPKPPPVDVSAHSGAFNTSMEAVLNAYYKMTDGFVKADLTVINNSAAELKIALDSLKVDELKTDTVIYQSILPFYDNTKTEIGAIIADPSLDEKKGSLNIFSNDLFTVINSARYRLAKLYWMECEDAFGEDNAGYWLSKEEKPGNPYGKKDCANLKVTIDHTAESATKPVADSTKK